MDSTVSALRTRILTKRRLKEAGIKPEKFVDQLKEFKGTDESQKEQYQKFEKKLMRLQKRKDERKARNKEEYSYPPESDSDSEDTDQLVVEVQKVEQNIKFFMNEIAKAKKDIEKYDRKLTRRLQKKHRRRIEDKRRIEEERKRLGIEAPTQMTMKEELEEAAFNAIDQALNDFKKNDKDYVDYYKSPEEERQERKPMRLRDYDDAPRKQPQSVTINLDEEEEEDEQNEPNEENKEYPDSDSNYDSNKVEADNGSSKYDSQNASNRSQPNYDSSGDMDDSPTDLRGQEQNLNQAAVSQNGDDIKLITKPEFTQFMNMAVGKSKLICILLNR